MANDNCLAEIRCPECCQADEFRIHCTAWFVVGDDGTDDGHDVCWDNDSNIVCTTCNHRGTVGEFTEDSTEDPP